LLRAPELSEHEIATLPLASRKEIVDLPPKLVTGFQGAYADRFKMRARQLGETVGGTRRKYLPAK
jgi:hypothetical protein